MEQSTTSGGAASSSKKKIRQRLQNILQTDDIEQFHRLTDGLGEIDAEIIMIGLTFYLDDESIQSLMKRCKNLDHQSNVGNNILMMAASYNREEIVKLLIKNKVNLNLRDNDGDTALILAIKNHNIPIAKLLVENGADTSIRDNDGKTALTYAQEIREMDGVPSLIHKLKPLQQKTQQHKTGAASMKRRITDIMQTEFRRRLKNILEKKDMKQFHVLTSGQYSIDADIVMMCMTFELDDKYIQPLIERCINIDAQYKYGDNIVMMAAAFNRKEIVEQIIKKNGNLNLRDNDGETALILAIKKKNIPIAQLLIENGADTTIRDNNDKTALMYAQEIREMDGVMPLIQKLKRLQQKTPDIRTVIQKLKSLQQMKKTADSSTIIRQTRDLYKLYISGLVRKNPQQIRPLIDQTRPEYIDYMLLTSCISDSRVHDDIINMLIDKCTDINAHDMRGSTILMNASRYNRQGVVQKLIEKGADLNVQNEDGDTALIIAGKYNNIPVATILIQNGANESIKNNEGKTASECNRDTRIKDEVVPLINKMKKKIQQEGIDSVYLQIERQLLEKIKINDYAHILRLMENPSIMLILAIKYKCDNDMILKLIENGADINGKDENGKTVLMYAIIYNDDVVNVLIRKGVNMDAQDIHGCTSLMYAFMSDTRNQIMRLLIDSGANTSIQNKQGKTVLMYSIYYNNKDILNVLILKKDDIDIQDEQGNTALMIAFINFKIDMAKVLILNGADTMTKRNNEGNTAFMLAVRIVDNENIFDVLLEKSKQIIDFQNEDGQTLLMAAVEINKMTLVKAIIKRGANLNLRDNDGRTALYIAIMTKRIEIAKILILNGADINIPDKNGKTILRYIRQQTHAAPYSDISDFIQQIQYAKQSLQKQQVPRFLQQRNITHNLFEAIKHDGMEYITRCYAENRTKFLSILNKPYEGYVPLTFAIQHSKWAILKYLCAIPQTDVNILTKETIAHTPLTLAIDGQKSACVSLLCKRRDLDLNKESRHKYTPLQFALSLREDGQQILEILLGAAERQEFGLNAYHITTDNADMQRQLMAYRRKQYQYVIYGMVEPEHLIEYYLAIDDVVVMNKKLYAGRSIESYTVLYISKNVPIQSNKDKPNCYLLVENGYSVIISIRSIKEGQPLIMTDDSRIDAFFENLMAARGIKKQADLPDEIVPIVYRNARIIQKVQDYAQKIKEKAVSIFLDKYRKSVHVYGTSITLLNFIESLINGKISSHDILNIKIEDFRRQHDMLTNISGVPINFVNPLNTTGIFVQIIENNDTLEVRLSLECNVNLHANPCKTFDEKRQGALYAPKTDKFYKSDSITRTSEYKKQLQDKCRERFHKFGIIDSILDKMQPTKDATLNIVHLQILLDYLETESRWHDILKRMGLWNIYLDEPFSLDDEIYVISPIYGGSATNQKPRSQSQNKSERAIPIRKDLLIETDEIYYIPIEIPRLYAKKYQRKYQIIGEKILTDKEKSILTLMSSNLLRDDEFKTIQKYVDDINRVNTFIQSQNIHQQKKSPQQKPSASIGGGAARNQKKIQRNRQRLEAIIVDLISASPLIPADFPINLTARRTAGNQQKRRERIMTNLIYICRHIYFTLPHRDAAVFIIDTLNLMRQKYPQTRPDVFNYQTPNFNQIFKSKFDRLRTEIEGRIRKEHSRRVFFIWLYPIVDDKMTLPFEKSDNVKMDGSTCVLKFYISQQIPDAHKMDDLAILTMSLYFDGMLRKSEIYNDLPHGDVDYEIQKKMRQLIKNPTQASITQSSTDLAILAAMIKVNFNVYVITKDEFTDWINRTTGGSIVTPNIKRLQI